MKKNIVSILVAVLFTAILVGCSGGSSATDPADIKGETFDGGNVSALVPDGWMGFHGTDYFDEYEEGYMDYAEKFKAISERMGALREQKALILEAQQADLAVNGRIQQAEELLNSASPEITEWDEELIRQAVETVKVLSDHEILVCLRGGVEIRQEVI